MKCFKTKRGLASHFDKSPGCAQAMTKVLQCLPTQQLSSTINQTAQESTAHTSDAEEESDEGVQESDGAMEVGDESDTEDLDLLEETSTNQEAPTNNQDGPDYEGQAEEYDNAYASNSGYCFGNEFYFQIKLMKILHNANAPNYLYQEVIGQPFLLQCAQVQKRTDPSS